jgi:ubiquinol-cytochrome c reductase iron-sulfur subunit
MNLSRMIICTHHIEPTVTNYSNISTPPSLELSKRRDFLYIATATVRAAGILTSTVPFIDQMNPDASARAAGGPVDLDLDKVDPGAQVAVRWRGKPIFVVHRTSKILENLKNPTLLAKLADPKSIELQQPPYAVNWHRSVKPEYAVHVGICTHLGCIPYYEPQPNSDTPAPNWLGGYFCPCHGSKYDLAGRVFSGVPAPYNLPIPPYHFVTDTKLRTAKTHRTSISILDR